MAPSGWFHWARPIAHRIVPSRYRKSEDLKLRQQMCPALTDPRVTRLCPRWNCFFCSLSVTEFLIISYDGNRKNTLFTKKNSGPFGSVFGEIQMHYKVQATLYLYNYTTIIRIQRSTNPVRPKESLQRGSENVKEQRRLVQKPGNEGWLWLLQRDLSRELEAESQQIPETIRQRKLLSYIRRPKGTNLHPGTTKTH